MDNLYEAMVNRELKMQASSRGMTVAELEEELALEKALAESISSVNKIFDSVNNNSSKVLSAVSNDLRTKVEPRSELEISLLVGKGSNMLNIPQPVILHDENNGTDYNPNDNESLNNKYINEISSIEQNSIWFRLPKELAEYILILLGDIDMMGVLYCVCKHSPFYPTEKVYKSIYNYIYPAINIVPAPLLLNRFGSYKSILINKPRVRLNGFYSLRTTYTRAPCNDNFWEDKKVESIEVKYYRNFRFFSNGNCLYSLDVIPVWDVPKYFSKGPIPKKVFHGTYTVNKREVNIQVEMHYCIMYFKLLLLDGSKGFDLGYCGKHNLLRLQEHTAVPLSVNREDYVTKFQLPFDCDLRFHRVWVW